MSPPAESLIELSLEKGANPVMPHCGFDQFLYSAGLGHISFSMVVLVKYTISVMFLSIIVGSHSITWLFGGELNSYCLKCNVTVVIKMAICMKKHIVEMVRETEPIVNNTV